MSSPTTVTVAARIDGLDALLTAMYDKQFDLLALLRLLRLSDEDVERLYEHHIGVVASNFLRLLEQRLCDRRQDGARMYLVLCRRFGLDGHAPATLASIGAELGISRERVRQIEVKTLRSCKSRGTRHFLENGLHQLALLLGGTVPNEPPPASNMPTVQADATVRCEADDIEFVGGLVAIIVASVPEGLSCGILSHILVGSHGPIVDAVVGHYDLAQHGMLKRLGFVRVKELVRLAGNLHPQLLVQQQRITLRPQPTPKTHHRIDEEPTRFRPSPE